MWIEYGESLAVIIGVVFVVCVIAWLLWHVDWKNKINSPTVIAAVVAASTTLGVSLAGVVSGWISASYQRSADSEKTKASILSAILLHYDATLVPDRNDENQRQRMTVLIQSGIIPDENGSICMALIRQGCPIKVLKAN